MPLTSSSEAAALKQIWMPRFAAGGLSLTLLVLLGRVAQLQISPSADLRDQMTPRVASIREPSVRGDVQDRRGRILSGTKFGYRVCIDPIVFSEHAKPVDESIVHLAVATGTELDKLGTSVRTAISRNDKILADEAAEQQAAGVQGFLNRLLHREDPRAAVVKARTAHTAEVTRQADQIAGIADVPLVSDVNTGRLETLEGTPLTEARFAEVHKVKRYLPITGVLTETQVAAVRTLKFKGVALERIPVRDYPGGSPAASLVGLVGLEQKGLMGAERLLDDQLKGKDGRITYYRDRSGKPLWMEPGQVKPSIAGNDARLSIDLELQRIACEELDRGIDEAYAAGGRLVILDPLSGEVLAMVDIVRQIENTIPYPWVDAPKRSLKKGEKPPPEPAVLTGYHRYIVIKEDENRDKYPALARNRCIEDIYEPGSTFKPFVWSTITELGLARPEEVFNTENGRWHTSYHRYIEDVTKRATMTWPEVLINSSNIGMIKASERLTFQQLHDVPVRFGFGKPTGIDVRGKAWAGEASGIVTPLSRWSKFSQTSVAYGHEIAVTPVQMVRAFSAFCRNGDLAGTLPAIHMTAVDPTGRPDAAPMDADFQSGIIYRVLPRNVALLTRDTMKTVGSNMESRWIKPPAEGWRYSLFGKSGTAEIPLGKAPEGKKAPKGATGYYDDQYNSSFIAGGPLENPRLVVLCVIDDPGPERVFAKPLHTHYGAAVAGPVVRRVMERALTYLGVPASPSHVEAPVDPNPAPKKSGKTASVQPGR